jgi:hypothetical protein
VSGTAASTPVGSGFSSPAEKLQKASDPRLNENTSGSNAGSNNACACTSAKLCVAYSECSSSEYVCSLAESVAGFASEFAEATGGTAAGAFGAESVVSNITPDDSLLLKPPIREYVRARALSAVTKTNPRKTNDCSILRFILAQVS